MVGLSSAVETVLDERAENAVLLVDAVEERANVTVVAGSTPGERRGVPGGLHNSRFHAQSPAQSRVPTRANRSPAARFKLVRSAGATRLSLDGQRQNTPSPPRCRR